MAKFNGKELKGAVDVNNVSTQVGLVFMRKAGTDGTYEEFKSTSNLNVTLDNTGAVDIKSESRGTALKVTQNKGQVSFDLTENSDISLLSTLYGLDKTSTVAGAKDITDREMKFDGDNIEFKEMSNDLLGVTTIVVKDITGITTYVKDTDYTEVLDENITRILRIDGGGIEADAVVSVSGSVNLNAQEIATYNANYVSLESFDFKVIVEIIEAGVTKYKTYFMKPLTLNSTYVLPFLNAVTAGGAQNTSLQFDLNEEGAVEIVDET